MTEESSDIASDVSKFHGQPWFAAGFAVVFCLLMLKTSHTWNLAGNALIRCPLGQQYVIEIQRLFTVQMLGPSSNSGFNTSILFLIHLGISAVGGLVSLAIGAAIRRVRA